MKKNTRNTILKRMGLNQVIHELSSNIYNQKWIAGDEAAEIVAVITHWLQSPSLRVPFLTNSILRECQNFINQPSEPSKKDGLTFCVEEPRSPYQLSLSFLFDNLPYPPPSVHDFTFIDLFAGIGGFRIAFQEAGGKCVFTSEWDKFAQQTYSANFGEQPFGDIRKINKNEIPDHDVLCAGFPCQPFSLAGVSKKQSLGRKHGFEDKTQGTLFFEIKEIY